MFAFGDNHNEVTITGNDSMQFDVKSFDASKGTDLKLTLRMSANFQRLLGHNLVVLKKGVSAIAFWTKVLTWYRWKCN